MDINTWRDLAALSFGVINVMALVILFLFRVELLRKADKVSVDDHHRRLGDHDSNIGNLYSKLHDEKSDREKMHREIIETLHNNHLSLMNLIQALLNGKGNNT